MIALFWYLSAISAQDACILFPKEAPNSSVAANEEILKSIAASRQACTKSQTLSDEFEKLTLGSKTLATWKCAKSSTRIDTKALAQAHPDIASAFTFTVMGSRRFLLKDAS